MRLRCSFRGYRTRYIIEIIGTVIIIQVFDVILGQYLDNIRTVFTVVRVLDEYTYENIEQFLIQGLNLHPDKSIFAERNDWSDCLMPGHFVFKNICF